MSVNIHKIYASEVNEWLEQALTRMIRIRLKVGALRVADVSNFRAHMRSLFAVGVPLDSFVLVNDDCTQWLWARQSAEAVEVVDVRVLSHVATWAGALKSLNLVGPVIVPSYREVAPERFEGFIVRALAATLICETGKPPFACLPTKRRVSLQGMTGAQMREFYLRASHIEEAKNAEDFVDDQQKIDRLVGRHITLPFPASLPHLPFESMERDGLAAPGHILLSILVNGKIIGGIWADVDGSVAHIYRVLIYRDYRGQEYFQEVAAAVIERLRFEGAKQIVLTIEPEASTLASLKEAGFSVSYCTYLLDVSHAPDVHVVE